MPFFCEVPEAASSVTVVEWMGPSVNPAWASPTSCPVSKGRVYTEVDNK